MRLNTLLTQRRRWIWLFGLLALIGKGGILHQSKEGTQTESSKEKLAKKGVLSRNEGHKILGIPILDIIGESVAAEIDKSEIIPSTAEAEPPLEIAQPAIVKRADGRLYYKVKRNDNIYDIAKAYGVSVQEITKANNIKNPSRIKEGQMLFIPSVVETKPSESKLAAKEEPELEVGTTYHTVKRGEGIYTIAKSYNVSIQKILHANKISDPLKIKPGMKILIPGVTDVESKASEKKPLEQKHELEETPTHPVVKKEDKLHKAIKTPQVSGKKTQETAKIEPAHKMPMHEDIVPKSGGIYHTVQRGESLHSIAKAHRVSVKQIQEANHIKNPSKIKTGQKIFIPLANGALKSYSLNGHGHLDLHKLIWPVDGKLRSRFGPRGKRFHRGIDICAPRGTPIRAVADGIVILSGKSMNGYSGYGNIVIVKHKGGIKTVYAHNKRNLVKMFESVKAGDIIAEVGSTGRASAPHLHFEIRDGKKPLNPLKYLLPD